MFAHKQILVVEDNELNRELLAEILSGQYRVLEAENGQEALDIVSEYRDDIDLILLDMMMPVMDGYTFLDKIKADKELSLIPVIVMTQSESEEDEIAALAHGAADFVPKPYRPQVILHRVAGIINLRETAAVVNQFQYDRLTGVYSKEFFYQQTRERLLDDPEGEYDIVSFNIENFKLFNDVFGMSHGDRLLCQSASLMMDFLTDDDGICGRLNGDRFMCLCRHRKNYSEDTFSVFSDKLKSLSNMNSNIVLKWGIYEIQDRSIPVEQMCDRAFLAADNVKGQYNRNFAVYDETLRDRILREQMITDAMETALEEGQFVVYLQPKYSLNNDGLAGAEALVRWIHPEWGFMSPGEFIPLFEKNGFIARLDQYVWDQTCSFLHDWHEKGYPVLPVSVNVSRADIYQSDVTMHRDIFLRNLCRMRSLKKS